MASYQVMNMNHSANQRAREVIACLTPTSLRKIDSESSCTCPKIRSCLLPRPSLGLIPLCFFHLNYSTAEIFLSPSVHVGPPPTFTGVDKALDDMVSSVTPSESSPLPNGHGEKRKAEDDPGSDKQTHTRSKRNRYISIAW